MIPSVRCLVVQWSEVLNLICSSIKHFGIYCSVWPSEPKRFSLQSRLSDGSPGSSPMESTGSVDSGLSLSAMASPFEPCGGPLIALTFFVFPLSVFSVLGIYLKSLVNSQTNTPKDRNFLEVFSGHGEISKALRTAAWFHGYCKTTDSFKKVFQNVIHMIYAMTSSRSACAPHASTEMISPPNPRLAYVEPRSTLWTVEYGIWHVLRPLRHLVIHCGSDKGLWGHPNRDCICFCKHDPWNQTVRLTSTLGRVDKTTRMPETTHGLPCVESTACGLGWRSARSCGALKAPF